MSDAFSRHWKNDFFLATEVLEISVDAVLRRTGLSASRFMQTPTRQLSAPEFFAIWHACEEEYGKKDFPVRLGKAIAQAPFASPIFAFYCSRSVRQGLERLALFKPLVGPLNYIIEANDRNFLIKVESADQFEQMPSSLGYFELVFVTELIRNATAKPFSPLNATLLTYDRSASTHLNCEVQEDKMTSLLLSSEDADRLLLTRNLDLWKFFEPHLKIQLTEEIVDASVEEAVRNVLLEALPSGETTIVKIAARMGLSSRNLQRKLLLEGTSFSKVIDSTRMTLAKNYLKNADLSLQEVAFLLGYKDTSSFFRAFRHWTGMTPHHFRKASQ